MDINESFQGYPLLQATTDDAPVSQLWVMKPDKCLLTDIVESIYPQTNYTSLIKIFARTAWKGKHI